MPSSPLANRRIIASFYGMSEALRKRAEWIAQHILPHEPALRRQLRRLRLPPELDVDDIIQEAYARLAQLESVAEIHQPKHYFFQVARSLFLMHMRRARIVPITMFDDLPVASIPSDEPCAERVLSDRQQLQELFTIVESFPPPSRQAFMLRMLEDLSHREIGIRLGMSENAVQKNIARSLKLLIQALGRGGHGEDEASVHNAVTAVRLGHDASRNE
jgi:RNA polymerase sigma-70 factor (ECF subfamily)